MNPEDCRIHDWTFKEYWPVATSGGMPEEVDAEVRCRICGATAKGRLKIKKKDDDETIQEGTARPVGEHE